VSEASQPRICICICTYDRYDVLIKAIDSAQRQSLDRSLYRIMVVDNSPDQDAAAEFAHGYHSPPFFDYRLEPTPGLSNARNVGARECGTEFIAYMDDDAIADPDWLKEILGAFDRYGERAAVVGGRVDPMWEIPRPAWLDDSLVSYVSVVNWGGDLRIADPKEWFAGTNISFRTRTLLDHGAFNVSLGRIGGGGSLLSNEETDLVKLIHEAGGLSIYQPAARVDHLVERRRLNQAWFRKRVAWQAVSDYLMSPKDATDAARKDWDWMLEYFLKVPPSQRTVRGLYSTAETTELFKHQLNATYLFVAGVLSGFEGFSDNDRKR
jgi:glycosyltransferase involved in cell wall biosynthesis